MRLWHKELIPVLPRQQLLSQWRECCCIASNIAANGTPNHILVNKVLEYPIDHFEAYCMMVMHEMKRRDYSISQESYDKLRKNINFCKGSNVFVENVDEELMFGGWHTNRYLWQCYFNLQEKYDCGGIPKEEWLEIAELAMTTLSMGVSHE